jgi:DNA-binding protein
MTKNNMTTEETKNAEMTTSEESAPVSEKKDNAIFIGGKPFMNYVTGVVMQFNTHNAPEVLIKSRGKFIAKAVDVAEVARRKFLADKGVEVKDVKIGSEEFENKEGRMVNVSILEITLVKK